MRLRACFTRQCRTLLNPMGWGHHKPCRDSHIQTTNHGGGTCPAALRNQPEEGCNWGSHAHGRDPHHACPRGDTWPEPGSRPGRAL